MRTRLIVSFVSLGSTLLPAPAIADVVTEWNAALSHCAEASLAQDPHVVARAFAIAHLGIREAVEAVYADRRYASSMDTLAAAASAAGFEIIRSILPMGESEFAALHARQLGTIPAGAGKDFGVKMGGRAAASWLARRENDRWPRVRRNDAAAILVTPEPTTARREGTSQWQTLVPFAMQSVGRFKAQQPFIFFANRIERNERLHTSKTLDLSVSALSATSPEFWRRDPLVIWNRIARALLLERPLNLRENAQFFSALNTALADSLLSASHWRVLYEEGMVVRGTVDESDDWEEQVPNEFRAEYHVTRKTMTIRIPVFNYPDRSAVLAGAAKSVAVRYWGDSASFSVDVDSPLVKEAPTPTWRFANVSMAAREAVAAGVLARRCTRESGVAGFELGTKIGEYALKRGGGK